MSDFQEVKMGLGSLSIDGQDVGYLTEPVRYGQASPPPSKLGFPDPAKVSLLVGAMTPPQSPLDDINAWVQAHELKHGKPKFYPIPPLTRWERIRQYIPKWNQLAWKPAFAILAGCTTAHASPDAIPGMAIGALLLGLGLARANREQVPQ